MDFAEQFKHIKDKVEQAAVEHEGEIRRAVEQAQSAADEKSGGKYTEQIRSAGAKADGLVDKLTTAARKRDDQD